MPGLGDPKKTCFTCDHCGPLTYTCGKRNIRLENPEVTNCDDWTEWKPEATSKKASQEEFVVFDVKETIGFTPVNIRVVPEDSE